MLTRPVAVVLRQYYLITGSFARFLPLFIWVGVDMVLWGFLTKYLNSVSTSQINLIPVLMGAILFWHFLMRTMQGVTLAFCEDVWARNLLNIFATPLTKFEYLSGLIFCSVITSLIGLGVMLAVTSLFFGVTFAGLGVRFVPFVMILFVFGISLGIFATAIILRLGPSSEWLVWPIPAIISPLSGVFYPISTLPDWIRPVSQVLPTSYVFESMRLLISNGTFDTHQFVLGGLLALVYLLLASLYYLSTYRHATRSGLIARHTAESF